MNVTGKGQDTVGETTDGGSMRPAGLSLWERVALTRWGRYITEIERTWLQAALARMARPGRAFDFGCGEGRWSMMLREHGWRTVCADIDPAALAKCRRNNPEAECILLSRTAKELPAADSSIDLLVCIEVPHVLESDWFQNEACRMVKPGGLIVGVFHNRDSVRGWFRARLDQKHGRFSFYLLGYRAWRAAMRRAGFEVLRAEGLCWFPFGRQSNSFLIPWAVRIEKLLGLRSLPTWSPWVLFVLRRQ